MRATDRRTRRDAVVKPTWATAPGTVDFHHHDLTGRPRNAQRRTPASKVSAVLGSRYRNRPDGRIKNSDGSVRVGASRARLRAAEGLVAELVEAFLEQAPVALGGFEAIELVDGAIRQRRAGDAVGPFV